MTTGIGQATPFSDASEFNFISFIVSQALAKLQTITICKVNAVHTDTQTVDVQVLVNLMTGNRTAVQHGVIYGRPYYRLQGGSSGIICDPAIGDIGILVFGSRDLTAVIAAKGQANPGSQRTFDWADGLYIGGLLNVSPTQYIQFTPSDGGITIVSPLEITLQAPTVTINASTAVNITSPTTTINGALVVTGDATLEGTVSATGAGGIDVSVGGITAAGDIVGDGTSLHTHDHNVVSVQTGTSTITTTPPL